ncbi:MAPEG family protein [Kordiimonas pumila]|uniref:MAPEG family protein n=1 Tax=Kordiimonas pumila TaxID=2161677 RepID=A0ABV7D5I7_9PROT|nr:MAPEG family protein [Kordiimonas pumila]
MAITLIAASFIGLLLIYLSYNVSKVRGKTKTSVGDGGHPELQNAIRAQGNLVEYAPMALLLLWLLEYHNVSQYLVLLLAIALVAGRYMHGLTFGKFEGRNPYRFVGTLLTWLVIVIASIAGLLKGYHIM